MRDVEHVEILLIIDQLFTIILNTYLEPRAIFNH